MLHELLLSLLGKPGGVIQQRGDKYQVDPTLHLLSPSEMHSINEIVQTGYYYAQIVRFIESELVETSFADLKKEPSVYRKAMAQGLRRALQPYQELILGIENAFLKSRHFTFCAIRAETMRYGVVMGQVWELVSRIVAGKYRGGVVIDILWQAQQRGSQWIREWLGWVVAECRGVFLRQVAAWVGHGQIIDSEGEFFIHKALHDPTQKHHLTRSNSQITHWHIFTLDQDLIPRSLLSPSTAGKILFIGKSVKILRSANRLSAIPSGKLLTDLKQLTQAEFSMIGFESVVERIRQGVAREMISLIVGEENLIRELQRINQYFLMLKGDFYHHFLEEAKVLETISIKDKQQRKLNDTCLPNTFMRLSNFEDIKRVSFEVKPLGFEYNGFRNFVNVCPVGNIDLIQGKYIRFSASGGALWHRNKQIVETTFTVGFTVAFKKVPTVFKTRRGETIQQHQSNMLALVFQNSKDISPSAHDNPTTLSAIGQYISVNVGYRYSKEEGNYESVLEVIYRNTKKYTKQVCLQSYAPKKLNFLDEGTYVVKVDYKADQMKIGVKPLNSKEEESIKLGAIRISNYLNLEMSRANIGFISMIQDYNCRAEVEEWRMDCKPNNYYADLWSDLSLKLKVEWPIDLILTPDLMEVFSRINKFLFPIRQTHIELEQLFKRIPRRFKEHSAIGATPSEVRQFRVFERKVCALGWRMGLSMGALWSYFESDVVLSAWKKLKDSITDCADFEEVIRMIGKYVNTIQTMFYFSALKIQRSIHEIVHQCRLFVAFFNKINEQRIDERTFKQYQHIEDGYSRATGQFWRLLKDLSKGSSSNHLFYLTQRLEGCIEQEKNYYMI